MGLKPKNLLEFQIRDNECRCALEELELNGPSGEWLNNHLRLFRQVCFTAPGLPVLPCASFGDYRFEHIVLFVNRYNRLNS